MLMQYGNVLCSADWKVEEKIPAGYSRVYYVYGGEVVYKDAQCQTMLKPGYLYIFPSASPYNMRQNIEDPLYCTFLHIDIFPAMITNLVEIPVEDSPALKHMLLAMAASIDSMDTKLIYALSDVFEIYIREHQLIQSLDSPISAVLLYISEHMRENITIADLCSRAGYNGQYFIRLFKQNAGMTPYRYITNYRMKEAKKMLKTDIPISQIASASGYSDIKSFSRTFKSIFGMSPSHFRKAYTVQP